MDFDIRKIQTAVQGGPESDEPLICPTDPDELDAFLLEHPDKSFWCGELLGGCGGKLTTRRFGTRLRVCHFAHLPGQGGLRPQCGYRDRGLSSADHLYVKTATLGWLREQGHTPRYHFIDRDDVPIGSLVDVYLNDRKLRFHMNAQVPPDWDAPDAGEPILGPGVRIPADLLEQRRYVNRVKFTTDGHRRILVLGTEVFGESTEWDIALEDCEITEDGRLKTPVVDRIWNTESRKPAPAPAPAAAPLTQPTAPPDTGAHPAGVQIGGLVHNIAAAVRRKDVPRVRQLCKEADQEMSRCEGPALRHLETAAENARLWLEARDHEHRALFTRLEQAVADGKGWHARTLLDQAKKLVTHVEPLTGHDEKTVAAAWKLLAQPPVRPAPAPVVTPFAPQTVDSREQEQRRTRRLAHTKARSLIGRLRAKGLPAQERRELLTELTPVAEAAGDWLSTRDRWDVQNWLKQAEKQAHVPELHEARKPPSEAVASAAQAVRGALKKAAREQRTTTWKQLEQQLGSALPHMSIADRIHVLILVDEATPPDHALLASLVVATDPQIREHYREIAAAQNLEAPENQDELRDVIDADVQQVFSTWSR
ncbi:hypothetical protein ACFW9I_22665 [[Kitasatospora] papulosa]|uniref:hypothetical protein n=1 Tax=[Kitasatospora] papulosa TaxID=1464011 RepID=UPI00369EB385